MKISRLISQTACVMTLVIGCSAHALTLKAADNHLPNDATVKGLKYMGENISKRTGGEIKIRVYANGALGDETQVLQDVQQGTVDIARVSVSNLQAFSEPFSVLSMPYLFSSTEQYLKFSRSPLADTFYAFPESVGIKGLTFYTSNFRSFYTRDKAIMTPDDLKGMKIRVMADPTVLGMMQRLGATATPLPYSEVFSAMQQGVIDGAENSPTTLSEARHGEMMKAYSYDEHTMVPDIMVISMKTWQKLTPEQQVIVREEALKSAEFQTQYLQTQTAKSKVDAQNMGVTFYYPDKQAFQARVAPMYDQLPADKAKLVADIRNVMNP